MENLWILTEERPKASVISQILKLYCSDFNSGFNNGNIIADDNIIDTEYVDVSLKKEIKVRPLFKDGVFQFTYITEGVWINNINNIYIKIVSGNSSFLDFLVFKQESSPQDGDVNNLLMAIEETKTNDDESRNTAVYQRASKFVFIELYSTNAKLYMLYNDELEGREAKKPSDTSIFGTNMLLTLGVKIVGKNVSKWFKPFESLEELIKFKSLMRKPPAGNVPIDITKNNDLVEISGRLSKPSDAGNIGHDPNIGALSLISRCVKYLGWTNDIIFTHHGVRQSYIDRTRGANKFLYICSMLSLKLQDINMPTTVIPPKYYWHYEKHSEKIASILLHVIGEYYGIRGIYQNHAGCERGYYKTPNNDLITLPKKDRNGENLYLPDLVLHDSRTDTIILIEGKMLSTLRNGIDEIQYYDSIENEYIKVNYPECTIYRYISIFGGNKNGIQHPEVIMYLNESGQIFINPDAPSSIKEIFSKEGVTI